jgi:maleate cis-trans isomerase
MHRESLRFLSKIEYARVIPRGIYNFALGVSSARASAYILSSSALNFFAVWGRLSFNLYHPLVIFFIEGVV